MKNICLHCWSEQEIPEEIDTLRVRALVWDDMKGTMRCAIDRGEKSIYREPPERCPYRVEHLVELSRFSKKRPHIGFRKRYGRYDADGRLLSEQESV